MRSAFGVFDFSFYHGFSTFIRFTALEKQVRGLRILDSFLRTLNVEHRTELGV
jgi:hypothetical protein